MGNQLYTNTGYAARDSVVSNLSSAGSHLVTVRYPGDAAHTASVGTYSVLVGNVVASGAFTLAVSDLTITSGGTGNARITLTPTGGYSGRIVWTLGATSTLGTGTVCYQPASPLVSGTTMTTTLAIGAGAACSSAVSSHISVQPVGPSASIQRGNSEPWRNAAKWPMCAGLLLCGSVAGVRRRTRLEAMLAITVLAAVAAGLNGCGGSSGSGGGSSPSGTTKAVYTITLKGNDSVNTSISAYTTFTLTIN